MVNVGQVFKAGAGNRVGWGGGNQHGAVTSGTGWGQVVTALGASGIAKVVGARPSTWHACWVWARHMGTRVGTIK